MPKSPNKELNVPILKDIVVPGREVTASTTITTGLSQVQLTVLQQQLEEIIEQRLQGILNKVTQDVVKDLKVYLNKKLPELIKETQK